MSLDELSGLRARFGFAEMQNEKRPFLTGDTAFKLGEFNSLAGFEVQQMSVVLLENPPPPVFVRQYFVGEGKEPRIRLRIAYCFGGYSAATAFLFSAAESFQREFPFEWAKNTGRTANGIAGEFGIAWSWERKDEIDHIYFARNNIAVLLDALPREPTQLEDVAAEIDHWLSGLETAEVLKETPFTPPKGNELPKLATSGRLDLLEQEAGETLFFTTTSGSVNRDPERNRLWYYRAGTEKGRQSIRIYAVKTGIAPKVQRLDLEVL